MNIFEDKMLFSKRLKEEMSRTGIRAIDLSRKTGIPISTISRYTSGEILPRLDYANRIAIALGVKPMWLFGYEESAHDEERYVFCPWCGKRL